MVLIRCTGRQPSPCILPMCCVPRTSRLFMEQGAQGRVPRPAASSGHKVSVADQLAGVPAPHMLASTISATWHMAHAWGLLTQAARPAPAKPLRRGPAPDSPSSVIERTLRAAGVLK